MKEVSINAPNALSGSETKTSSSTTSSQSWRPGQENGPLESGLRVSLSTSQDGKSFADHAISQRPSEKTSEGLSRAAGGVKHDAGKPLLALLPFAALEEVGRVMTFGGTKYGYYNWLGGLKFVRLLSAGLRHVFAYLRGEDLDKESGLSHLAHAVACFLMVLEFVKQNRADLDDRYKGDK